MERNVIEVLVAIGAFQEVQSDLQAEHNIDEVFNLEQSIISRILRTIRESIGVIEHKDEWRDRQGIDDK